MKLCQSIKASITASLVRESRFNPKKGTFFFFFLGLVRKHVDLKFVSVKQLLLSYCSKICQWFFYLLFFCCAPSKMTYVMIKWRRMQFELELE